MAIKTFRGGLEALGASCGGPGSPTANGNTSSGNANGGGNGSAAVGDMFLREMEIMKFVNRDKNIVQVCITRCGRAGVPRWGVGR